MSKKSFMDYCDCACTYFAISENPSHLFSPSCKAELHQGVAMEYISCEPTDSARELFNEDCEPVEEEQ